MGSEGLRAAEEKMRAEGVGEAAVRTFGALYEQLAAGESGLMPDATLAPLKDVPDAAALSPSEDATAEALRRTIVLKLNGGLGTSMGMERAKSLLPVKDGLTFLEVIARQVLELRRTTGAALPLVLMDSFYTRDDTLAALEQHPELVQDVPSDFLQNKEPKLTPDGLAPVEWPQAPDLEWCPPGHGDVYTALATSGMLRMLLDAGYRYAFLSNSDNLGAVLDPAILGWVAEEQIPFLMEICPKTPADRKGGHPALRREDGQLVLRETAQTPEEDLESFSDMDRWAYFNTNNLWVDLEVLERTLNERDGVLGLPMIVNRKTVDPGDKSSPAVIQLETAMGAAVGVFAGAQVLRVPRHRFVPVKTTNDLLTLRSDAYDLGEDGRLELVAGPPNVDLDPDRFKLVRDFDARFPAGPPSLRECRSLRVRGDVRFEGRVVCRGDVSLDGPLRVPAGTELTG